VGHHDWFNAFQEWDEPIVEEILHDPGVIRQSDPSSKLSGLSKSSEHSTN
jgi:hypothetical protein